MIIGLTSINPACRFKSSQLLDGHPWVQVSGVIVMQHAWWQIMYSSVAFIHMLRC